MTRWVPVLLAAAAAGVLTAVPPPGRVRLRGLGPLERLDRRPRADPSGLLVVLAGAVVVGAVLGPVAGVLAAAATVALRRSAVARAAAADRRRERARALDALSLLGAELRSGRPPFEALAAAADLATGPSRGALLAAAASARLGGDVAGALDAPGSAVPEVLRGLAACWQVCSAVGGGLAASVERLEDGLRAAEEQRRTVEAELAGPTATAGLLAVLPLAGIGLAAALGAHPLRVLLHTPAGGVCVFGGLVLDGLGLLWARRLVAAALPP
jgi:tight adherence protein B